jgi:hypothetical protein
MIRVKLLSKKRVGKRNTRWVVKYLSGVNEGQEDDLLLPNGLEVGAVTDVPDLDRLTKIGIPVPTRLLDKDLDRSTITEEDLNILSFIMRL